MATPLFERLRSEGIDLIEEMIASEFQETLTLDFKANLSSPGDPLFSPDGRKLTKTGRKTISKAASAFANSMGGVLILGVDCRSDEGVDCARLITPIPNLSSALSTLNNELHSLTTPSVVGIEAISIADKQGNFGLIALSIPRSQRRPHRSNARDGRHYYKRSGTSSVEMEHYEIEDAFLSNQSPDLLLSTSISGVGSGGPGARQYERTYYAQVTILATNLGGGTAKSIFFECKNDPRLMNHFGSRHSRSSNQIGIVDGALQVAPPIDLIIHPGTKRRLESFQAILFHRQGSDEVRIDEEVFSAESESSFTFEFSISADGMRQKMQTIKFRVCDLVEQARIPVRFRGD